MKDLRAFAKEVSNDKNLAHKVSKAKNAKEVVSIAADNGYSFDESELMKVSGGCMGGSKYVGDVDVNTGDIDLKTNTLNFDFSKINADINQNISGQKNTAQNTGTINVSKIQ